MARRISFALVICLSALLVPRPIGAAVGDAYFFEEQRVSGRGLRVGADQGPTDISSRFIVWQDHRGTSVRPLGNAIWSKNLSTRGEAPVTTLSTAAAPPRISGSWVVWADRPGGSTNDDIFARKLPRGRIRRVTRNAATQLNPAIDGKTVVWEDKRSGDIDIFKKVIGTRAEKPVVIAPGDQTLPSVSGNTVAWRDGRRGLTAADVYVRIGDQPEQEIERVTGAARSISQHQVAVAGSRLLWNEVDPAKCGLDCAPKILMTCILPTCGAPQIVDQTALADPDGSTITDIDVSGTQATWVKKTTDAQVLTADLATCDIPPCEPAAAVDTVASPGDLSSARLDGSRFAWTRFDPAVLAEGSDVFWRDFVGGVGPLRANSIGLGPFIGHSRPAADGNFVTYEGPDIWATELSPRRHFEVSTNLSTGFSAPAIGDGKVSWSDRRKCNLTNSCTDDSDDTYQVEISPSFGSEGQISTPDGTGGPPDADSATTAWRCLNGGGDPTDICVHNGTSITHYDVSGLVLDPSSAVGDMVRISGALVAWYEFFEGGGPDARLHVLDTTGGPPGTDNVVGSGIDMVGQFPDFDISGSNVVWAGGTDDSNSAIWLNTATSAPPSDPFEVPVNHHLLGTVTLDGPRMAWLDCSTQSQGECGVYTRLLSELDSHLVTTDGPREVRSPFVDGDRIFWNDNPTEDSVSNFCCAGGDIFMEDVSGTALPPPDTTPPGSPISFTAGPNTGSVALSWAIPPDPDFFRIRILRRYGTRAPTSPDDPKATIIFEGSGTSTIDDDVRAGAPYTYKAFAFDQEPNFSLPAVAHTH